MFVSNAEIAASFDRIADLLEIQGDNPFRIRAYRNAARTIEGLSQSLAGMVEQGAELEALPGIGEDLAAEIREIVTTGGLRKLRQLQQRLHRHLWAEVEEVAAVLLDYLRALPGVKRVEMAGSFRRRRETVGDLDILAVAAER